MTAPHAAGDGGDLTASARDQAQQAVLYGGVQNVHFHGVMRPRVTLLPMVTPPELVGRDGDVAALVARIKTGRGSDRPVLISALHGMAGVGKTALARAVAAAVKDDFPDARVEVDLYGFTPALPPARPADVLAELLSWAGFDGASIPDSMDGRIRLWRAWLAPRRVLLVLDNARAADQVRALVPQDAPGCLALITSRDDLDDLDGVHRVRLDTLDPPDAVALLHRRSGRLLSESGAVEEIARLCGYLPLTLEPVGRLLARQQPQRLLGALRGALADGRQRFHHLPAVRQQLKAAFLVSYEALTAEQQLILRWCARHPGPDFDAVSIAALSGEPDYVASLRLDELRAQAMLSALPADRYTFHDLILECVRDLDSDESDGVSEERQTGRDQLATALRERVKAATRALTSHRPTTSGLLFATPVEARAWLAAATSELVTVAEVALRDGRDAGMTLGEAVGWWLRLDDRLVQARDLYTLMSDIGAQGADRLGQANALIGMGDVAGRRHEYEQANDAYIQARALYEEIGYRLGQANTLKGVGDVARMRHEYEQANDAYIQARALYGEIGDRLGQANTLIGVGHIARMRHEYEQANDAYIQARALYEEIGDRLGQAHALFGVGEVAVMRHEYEQADDAYTQARILYAEIGYRLGQANTLKGVGHVAVLRHEYEQANDAYIQARALYEEIGYRLGQAHALKGVGHVAVMRHEYEQANDAYIQARALYEEIGDRLGQAHALKGVGYVAVMRHEYEQANDAYIQARILYAEIGYRLDQAHALLGMGEVARMRHEYEQANDAFTQARALYEEIGDRLGQANVLCGLARLAEAQDRRPYACEAYAAAQEIYQTIGIEHWAQHCQSARNRLTCE